MNLFDFVEAKRQREEAVARVETNADSDWKSVALKAVSWLAMTQPSFTTDDVWAILATEEAQTHESRALGAVMLRAASIGYVEATDRYVPSNRPECHQGPKKVWRSLLWDGVEIGHGASN